MSLQDTTPITNHFIEGTAQTLLPSSMNVESQQLFQFDLNFDSLKKYLNNIANTINQHASLINALQNEVQNRIIMKILPDNYQTLHEGMNFANNDIIQNLRRDLGKSLKEENNPQNSELNKLSNKLAMLTTLASSDSMRTQQLEAKVAALQDLVSTKAGKDELKEKHQKLKTSLENDLNDNKSYSDKKMFELEKKLFVQLNTYEDKIGSVEKNTLWRIQDCEEIVKKRVTQEYVDNSLQTFQEKLLRDINVNKSSDSERIEAIYQDFSFKIKSLSETMTEKQSNLKQNLKDLDDKFIKKGMMKDQFEDYKKFNVAHLNDIVKRLKDLEKQNELSSEFERIQTRIKFLEEFIKQINNDVDNRFADILAMGSGKPPQAGDLNLSSLSPHKICEIETNIKRQATEYKRFRLEYEDYKKATDMKLEHFDMAQFEKIKSESTNIEPIIKELKDRINEQLVKIDDWRGQKQEMERMNKKIESLKDLERRVQKIMRDIDINGITRQLRNKAEGEDVLKDLAIVDNKINNNTESIGYIKKDIDNLLVLYKKVLQHLQNTTVDANQMAILSTKKLHSFTNINCLSCGNHRNNASGSSSTNHKITSSQIKQITEPCNTSASDTNGMSATGTTFANTIIQKMQRSESNGGKTNNSTTKFRPCSARK